MADEFSDDYVAELLKQDAANARRGVSAGPRSASAPKPNMRFLHNILRDTRTHNAALQAREQEDARRRRERLTRKAEGRLSPPPDTYAPRSRRNFESNKRDEDGHRSKRRHVADDEGHGSRQSRRSGETLNRDDRKQRERSRSHRSTRKQEKSARHRDDSPHGYSKESHRSGHRRHRRRSNSTDEAFAGLIDSKGAKTKRSRRQVADRSPEPVPSSKRREDGASETDDESGESFVGPRKPSSPKVQKRGRGAFSSSNETGINERFSQEYEPSKDVQPVLDESVAREDALETIRAREQWKATGAQRLRDAGFDEAAISKWESKNSRHGGEGDVDDVRWRSRGEGREWDRGKLVKLDADANGSMDVEVKPSWALSRKKKL